MKSFLLIPVILLMNFRAISQTKQNESGGKVISSAEDIALIRYSNELGKKAREMVPVLEKKIANLESIRMLQDALLISRDSTITDLKVQVYNLQEVVQNDSLIIGNRNDMIALKDKALIEKDRKLRGEKRKTRFVGIAGILLTGGALYLGSKN